MGNQKMTEYERRRLENIKRNDEMLAALKIHSMVNELTAAAKRERAQSSPVKKPKTESPVVLRGSLRIRGVPPDAATAGGLGDDIDDEKIMKKISKRNFSSVQRKSPGEPGPLAMRDAYTGGDGLDQKLIETVSQCYQKSAFSEGPGDSIDYLEKSENFEKFKARKRLRGSVDVGALELKSDNIALSCTGENYEFEVFPFSGYADDCCWKRLWRCQVLEC